MTGRQYALLMGIMFAGGGTAIWFAVPSNEGDAAAAFFLMCLGSLSLLGVLFDVTVRHFDTFTLRCPICRARFSITVRARIDGGISFSDLAPECSCGARLPDPRKVNVFAVRWASHQAWKQAERKYDVARFNLLGLRPDQMPALWCPCGEGVHTLDMHAKAEAGAAFEWTDIIEDMRNAP